MATAWLEALESDAAMELYADGLQPSAEGAYPAALVIYARLLATTPLGLPARLRLRSRAVLALPEPVAARLQEAAAAALGP